MGFFTASRLNKMKAYFRDGDYEKAITLADKINPTEIRTAYDLSMMADIYMTAGRYGAARRVFAEMYKRNKTVRVCKQLITLNIKLKNVKQAIYYVKELSILDNEDYERFVFQYQIGRMLKQPDVYLIECLKRVREADYIDKWALELAKLFYKTGRTDECVAECQNIKLWFPDTDFAAKADLLLGACRTGASYEKAVAGRNEQRPVQGDLEEQKTENCEGAASEEAYTEEEYFEEDGSETEIPEYDEYADDEADDSEYDEYADDEADDSEYDEYADNEADDSEYDEYADDEADGSVYDKYPDDEAVESVYDDADDKAEDSIYDDYDEEICPDDGDSSDFDGRKEPVDDRSYPVRRNTASVPSMTEISVDEDEVFFDLSDSVKDIMEEESKKEVSSEPEEREDIATTLVNDALTAEIMNALREQEKNGSVGDKDAVDESILRMLNEE